MGAGLGILVLVLAQADGARRCDRWLGWGEVPTRYTLITDKCWAKINGEWKSEDEFLRVMAERYRR